jgi:hypothetical protein
MAVREDVNDKLVQLGASWLDLLVDKNEGGAADLQVRSDW